MPKEGGSTIEVLKCFCPLYSFYFSSCKSSSPVSFSPYLVVLCLPNEVFKPLLCARNISLPLFSSVYGTWAHLSHKTS